MRKILLIVGLLIANFALALEWNTCIAYWTRTDANAKWTLQDDGSGVYIKSYSSSVAKPNEAQLIAIEADAILWKSNQVNDASSRYENWDDVKLRKLAKLFVKEINKLRVKNGDAPYTKEQIENALRGE